MKLTRKLKHKNRTVIKPFDIQEGSVKQNNDGEVIQ